jgi:GntR family transcriptional regulator, transcriptional repressor for pyruvate dehydrogenase complex
MIAFKSLDLSSPKSCFDFRVGIEGEAAATAARNRTQADLDRLLDVLQRMENLEFEREAGLAEDFAFHLQVARASHNDYFVSALQSLENTIFDGMLLARTTSGLKTAEKVAAINQQHRLVYDAILAQDDVAARDAMRSHLFRCKQSTSHWDEPANS